MLNKVPALVLSFWIIKILATTVGETAADFLNTKLGLGLYVTFVIMTSAFLIALGIQLTRTHFIPAIYWTVVVLISVVGTLTSDMIVDHFGVPLWFTSTLFAAILAIVFVAWYRSERTLSVHDVRTTRREAYYWTAILFTFALGTSAGDLVAEALHLGYPLSALAFATAIGTTYAAYRYLKLDAIVAFWIAYVLTRPLGASLGDFLSQPTTLGGLGFGTTTTSAVFFAIIAVMVVMTSSRGLLDRRGPVPAVRAR